MEFNFDRIIVHNGVFHADDVMCVAMAKTLNPDIKVERTRNPKILEEAAHDDKTIICDVGLGKYDHHQKDAEVREDGYKYAACGLMFRDYGDQLFKNDDDIKFFEDILKTIEHLDNGEAEATDKEYLITKLIQSQLPTWEHPNLMEYKFNESITHAQSFIASIEMLEKQPEVGILMIKTLRNILKDNEQQQEEAKEKATELITDAFQKSDKVVVTLDKTGMPWQETLIPTSTQFVIYQTTTGQVNLQAVPPELGSFAQKVPIPEDFLKDTVCFNHAGHFLCGINPQEQGMTPEEAIETLRVNALDVVHEKYEDLLPYNDQQTMEQIIDAITQDPNAISNVFYQEDFEMAEKYLEEMSLPQNQDFEMNDFEPDELEL